MPKTPPKKNSEVVDMTPAAIYGRRVSPVDIDRAIWIIASIYQFIYYLSFSQLVEIDKQKSIH